MVSVVGFNSVLKYAVVKPYLRMMVKFSNIFSLLYTLYPASQGFFFFLFVFVFF